MRDDLAEGVAQLAQAPMPAVAVSVFGVDEVLSHGAWGTANMRTGEPATLDHHWDLASLANAGHPSRDPVAGRIECAGSGPENG